MLQQDKPDDFVIATGIQYSVRDFINDAAEELDMKIRWEGEGLNEIGYLQYSPLAGLGGGISSPTPSMGEGRGEGDKPNDKLMSPSGGGAGGGGEKPIVRVDPRYFRPTEVETLLGDPTKAQQKLGWKTKITFKELVSGWSGKTSKPPNGMNS